VIFFKMVLMSISSLVTTELMNVMFNALFHRLYNAEMEKTQVKMMLIVSIPTEEFDFGTLLHVL
jgi:hypothetical protein